MPAFRSVLDVETTAEGCPVQVHSVFGHGSVFLWAEDGTLMATASQSALVRLWQGEGYRPATAGADDGEATEGTDSDS